MDIHLVSTLTSEDEERVAGTFLTALTELLDKLPIAYALRIETSGTQVMKRTTPDPSDAPVSTPPLASPLTAQ